MNSQAIIKHLKKTNTVKDTMQQKNKNPRENRAFF